MADSKYLSGRVALVTGGSRGIGRAICVRLAQAGAEVYVNYANNAQAADETVRLCKEAGATAESIGFAVEQSSAVDDAVDRIKEKTGHLDILINNAGISKDGLFVRFKDEDWQRLIDVNLSGAFYCARAAARIMMKSRWGRIINISSVVGEIGNAGQAAYVASKAGLIGLTKALAKELAIRNVTVNAVTPGYIGTDMTSEIEGEHKEQLMSAIPLGRIGVPEDIAGLVCFLAGEESSYITGQILGVNGGMRM